MMRISNLPSIKMCLNATKQSLTHSPCRWTMGRYTTSRDSKHWCDVLEFLRGVYGKVYANSGKSQF